MRRLFACTVVALAGGAAIGLVPAVPVPAVVVPEAGALAAADLLGSYSVKIRGEGWAARVPGGKGDADRVAAKAARVAGAGTLLVRPRDADVNDGLVTVEIVLDAETSLGLLGGATPGKPAFQGTAAPVGISLALIDSGQPNYVNAANLHFDGGGRRVSGTWMAVFPANEAGLATQKFATGVTVTLNGRRSRRDAPVRVR